MKVAIVKLSAMGDIIHAMVALQYIKLSNPSLQIDWIVEQGFVKVLEGNPDIDRILPVNLKAIKKNKKEIFNQINLLKEYANRNYDLIIDAQGLLKSAITAKLLGKSRAGFSKDSIREGVASYFYNTKVNIAYDANTIDRNAKVMSEPLGVSITSEMILNKEPFLYYEEVEEIESTLSNEKKNIIFVIGSTWESRNYPKEKFATIANELKQNVLIAWGSEEEKSRAEWIASHSDYAKVLPKINLNALKAIIGKSDLLIGNDTGPTHMAWGLNIPSITIFGPTPVNRVYETSINRVIKSSSIVDHYKLNKNDFSIAEIEAEDIIILAKELLHA
ncbi:MAG: lipopolysaccharide heptosyltransferase I [Campylobacterota bacterium]|nr:lipopolysaccharide heptosyltransferase I [Campylobacterota bacterium]